MQLTPRPYRDDDDYWRIREFLRRSYALTAPVEFNWPVYRFDYWRWHEIENIFHLPLPEILTIWETPAGEIGAVLQTENYGEVFLQVDPTLRNEALEAEMVDLAEERLAATCADGSRRLEVWALRHDRDRQGLLLQRGYARGEWPEYQRRRPMSLPIFEGRVAEGYVVRALGSEEEHPARSWVSWRAFHPEEPFEPVGTDPAYQRRGLANAVMCEGLRRVARLGTTMAHVGSYSAAAGALYAAQGFVEYDLRERWIKVF